MNRIRDYAEYFIFVIIFFVECSCLYYTMTVSRNVDLVFFEVCYRILYIETKENKISF